MMKGIVWYGLVMFFPFLLKGETNLMFEKANQLYHNKQYTEAAELYNQLLQDGYDNHELYYNLGNAYYKSKDIGMAVWCYEQALRIRPCSDYTDNLNLAKKQINPIIQEPEPIFFVRWWNKIVHLFSRNGWSKMALSLFLVAIAGLILNLWKRQVLFPVSLIRTILCASVASLIFLAVQFLNNTQAIVVKPETKFSGISKQQSSKLGAGTKVEIVNSGKTQLQIQLADGRVGSIDRKAVKTIQ